MFYVILKRATSPELVVTSVATAGSKVASNVVYVVVPSMEHSCLGGAGSDVATSHVQLIKVLTMPQDMDLYYCFINVCPRTRVAEAIIVLAAKLIKSMFSLHVVYYSGCKFVCF